MLNILVCVKQIPDVDLVKMDPETGNLIRAGVPTLTNPLDLNALEAAVRVKEKYGGQITLITMGPPMTESTLRECLAVGGDKAVLITGRPFSGADTLSTSYTILMAAEMEGKFDLIFCGKETLDGATGQMASQLAERFDASQISCCLSIEEISDGKVRAARTLETGKEIVEATLPCLITVEKDNFYGRLPIWRPTSPPRKPRSPSIPRTTSTGWISTRSASPAPGPSCRRSIRPSCPALMMM